MKALVIAGGLGTRLRPLTNTRPKHLLPIANRPHIQHVFDLLRSVDVNEVVLLTSYLAESFDEVIRAERSRGLNVAVAHEEEPLGTAGAIKNAEDLLDDSTFLAFNGDVLTNVDLAALIAWHRERSAGATILLTPVDDPSRFGVVPTDSEGRVESFIEKPAPGTAPTNLINAGVYVFEPSVLERIPPGQVFSAERELFPSLVAEGTLFARAFDAYWTDIGTPQSLLQANLDALVGNFPTDAVEYPGEEAILVAPDALVSPTAKVFSSCVGSGAVVGTGAIVRDSVLMEGARVHGNSVVTASIMGADAELEAGRHLTDAVLADGEIRRD